MLPMTVAAEKVSAVAVAAVAAKVRSLFAIR